MKRYTFSVYYDGTNCLQTGDIVPVIPEITFTAVNQKVAKIMLERHLKRSIEIYWIGEKDTTYYRNTVGTGDSTVCNDSEEQKGEE